MNYNLKNKIFQFCKDNIFNCFDSIFLTDLLVVSSFHIFCPEI